MLIIDNVLGAPARGLMFVLKEIHKAVQAERADEKRRVMAELKNLHRHFDEGLMTAGEFDEQERMLLDRLDNLRGEGDDGDGDQTP